MRRLQPSVNGGGSGVDEHIHIHISQSNGEIGFAYLPSKAKILVDFSPCAKFGLRTTNKRRIEDTGVLYLDIVVN